MRIHDFISAAILCSSAAALADADSHPEYDDVVIADTYRTAFYERVPRALQSRMRAALAAACEAAGSNPPAICKAAAPAYLRAVLVTGERLQSGWICSEDFGKLRYMLSDMLDDAGCVGAGYDEAHHMKVYFDQTPTPSTDADEG